MSYELDRLKSDMERGLFQKSDTWHTHHKYENSIRELENSIARLQSELEQYKYEQQQKEREQEEAKHG